MVTVSIQAPVTADCAHCKERIWLTLAGWVHMERDARVCGDGEFRAEPKLTEPQRRYLAEIREAGEKTFNNRLRPTLVTLERYGYITVEWDMRPHASGSGISLTGLNTARPVRGGQ